MRIKIKQAVHELLYDRDRLSITFDPEYRYKLIDFMGEIGSIDPEAEYDIIIKKHEEGPGQGAEQNERIHKASQKDA